MFAISNTQLLLLDSLASIIIRFRYHAVPAFFTEVFVWWHLLPGSWNTFFALRKFNCVEIRRYLGTSFMKTLLCVLQATNKTWKILTTCTSMWWKPGRRTFPCAAYASSSSILPPLASGTGPHTLVFYCTCMNSSVVDPEIIDIGSGYDKLQVLLI